MARDRQLRVVRSRGTHENGAVFLVMVSRPFPVKQQRTVDGHVPLL